MDHVDEPFASSGDAGFALEVLQKEMAPARAVDAGGAQDDGGDFIGAGRVQQQLFGVQQQAAQFIGGLGGAGFLDQRTIGLAIDAGAAGIDQFFGRGRLQPLEDVAHAFHINLPVFLRPALVGRHSVDHPIERPRQAVQIGPAGDVGREWAEAALLQSGASGARPSQAENLVTQPRQFRPEGKSDVATTDNQNTHSQDESIRGAECQEGKLGFNRP